MKSARTGTFSGCLIWIILFSLISSCVLPLAMIAGGFSSTTNFAMQTLGRWLCPEGTTAESYSYATTTTDEFGNSQPGTAYELHCVDTGGNVVKEDPILYAFIWIGIVGAIGLVIASLLALALAAPGGVLIARWLNRARKPNMSNNIEPE